MRINYVILMILVQFCLAAWSRYRQDENRRKFYVGVIVDENDLLRQNTFRKCLQYVNKENKNIQLEAVIEKIDGDNGIEAMDKACSLLENSVVAIYGPNTPNAMFGIQSVCKQFNVPHLQLDWGYQNSKPNMGINVHPHFTSFNRAIHAYVKGVEWDNLALIYSSEDGLLKFRELFLLFKHPVIMRKWNTEIDDQKYIIKHFSQLKQYLFIVDIPYWELDNFFKLIEEYGMNTTYYAYVFTDLDISWVKLYDFKQRLRSNITAFSIFQGADSVLGKDETFRAVLKEIKIITSHESGYSRSLSQEMGYSPTQTALIYDSLNLLAISLNAMVRTTHTIPPVNLTCQAHRNWSRGLDLYNAFTTSATNHFTGLTGNIRLDKDLSRTDINLTVIEYHWPEFQQYGYWNPAEGLQITKTVKQTREDEKKRLSGQHLHITTKEEPPYVMYNGSEIPGQPKSEDPKHWIGFCIDMMNEISKALNFTYRITLVKDSTYGSMTIKDGKEEWNGIVKELILKQADLAVGSFTISYDRIRFIDFTTPFMYLGISIIYKRPVNKGIGLFSFLQPLSPQVWGYIFAATIMVSLVLFVVARFSPYEWKVKHPCNVDSNMLENDFNVPNSLWFTFGALMQKGSDIMPHALSTRIIAGFWWFFTLIVISSYTANLAAYLTVARMDSVISDADSLSRQNKIKYGMTEGGSTKTFFETTNFSTYKRMWQHMKNNKGALVNTTEVAIERVRTEDFAFLLESTMCEYYTQRDCSLMQIGGKLDSKGYGIGLPKGSPYRDALSTEILNLQKNQKIEEWKLKWWRRFNVTVSCDSMLKKKNSHTSSLGMEKVAGCFVMLLMGMGVSLLLSIFELVWNAQKTVNANRSLNEEVARNFRFSTGCASVRSRIAEENAQLPPPLGVSCITEPNRSAKQNLKAAFAYAPCLPLPAPSFDIQKTANDLERDRCNSNFLQVGGQLQTSGMANHSDPEEMCNFGGNLPISGHVPTTQMVPFDMNADNRLDERSLHSGDMYTSQPQWKPGVGPGKHSRDNMHLIRTPESHESFTAHQMNGEKVENGQPIQKISC